MWLCLRNLTILISPFVSCQGCVQIIPQISIVGFVQACKVSGGFFGVCNTSLYFIVLAMPIHVRWVPATTAWHILRLQIEERPPAMEGSCEYIEAAVDKRQGVLKLGGWAWG
jgi:hypothetical protein